MAHRLHQGLDRISRFDKFFAEPAMPLQKSNKRQAPSQNRRGTIFVEYVLLLTIVGIGVIVGLVCVREALVNELIDLAAAINAIEC